MKRFLFIISLFVFNMSLLTLTTSCSETEEAGEFDNWTERNKHYVDSIASLADRGANGWTKIVAYNLNDSVEQQRKDNTHYIYIQKLESGSGNYKAQYRDSVRVHYLGRLIPSDSYAAGYVFDKSYNGYELSDSTDVPALLSVGGTVTGFSTALQHMVEGDRWKIVVPSYIGYGTSASGSIPGSSTLIFDLKVARIYPYKSGLDSSWH